MASSSGLGTKKKSSSTETKEHSDEDVSYALYIACRNGDLYAVRQHLSRFPNTDPNEHLPNGSTALHVASYYGHTPVVHLILQQCSVNYLTRNQYGLTAYEEAYNMEIREMLRSAQDETVKRQQWPVLLELNNKPQTRTRNSLVELFDLLTATCFTLADAVETHDLNHRKWLIIDAEHVENDEIIRFLKNLSSVHSCLPAIYILAGSSSKDFLLSLNVFSSVQGVFDNKEALVVRWALDSALEHRKIGQQLLDCSDAKRAHISFNESLALYQRLAGIVNSQHIMN
ncbi:unnamed protein product [Adineta ricciae]|uniref:Uncharacterized protein n=1 Tax=Adineta ricciae TaxID=249248 RepID=A0A815SSK7_ADIRI|nr:unnamed protein product [Adineta ricciae]CAF1661847.1 unnamed protein product [Adineta ricciae]